MYLSDEKEEAGEPSSFCMFLRKKLSNSFLRKIEQVGVERVVRMSFETKDGVMQIYVELFGQGNIVACNSENVIMGMLTPKKWKDRYILKGETYTWPEAEHQYDAMGRETLQSVLVEMKQPLVKVLATEFHLGGVFAEEACMIAQVDKNSMELSSEAAEKVVGAVEVMLSRVGEPVIVKKGEKIVDILPFPLETRKDKGEFSKAESLNAAYASVYFERLKQGRTEQATKQFEGEIKKLQNIVDQQSESLQDALQTAEEGRKVGDEIYTNYSAINTLLIQLKKDFKVMEFTKLKEKYQSIHYIKEIHKDGTVVIEIKN